MELHSYQQRAVDFIETHPVAALFLDMGLGKTVTTLTAIWNLMLDTFEVRRVLVVAPLRVARDTWPVEIDKWEHLKGLTYAVAVGTAKERLQAVKSRAMITIINRENIPWLIDSTDFDYDMLVVDELSSFKNPSAKRLKALLKVRPRLRRVVGLTGTPAPNSLLDLWAQFRLLDMGERLGRFITAYRNEFFVVDRMLANHVCLYAIRPGADRLIYKRLNDITVSMKAEDYLQMPKLLMQFETAFLNPNEQFLYNAFKKDHVLPCVGACLTAANAAVLCGKLSQLANGACYLEDGTTQIFHNHKLDILEDLIEAANGKPLLVAYWFKFDLERIRGRFPEARELKTSADFKAWNAGKITLALIHPASAGHGLNLQQGGNVLVWFGLTWSLELYQQTNARLYRQGQQAGTVVIKHIITRGTIDEQIYQALSQKNMTQQALIDAVRVNLNPGGPSHAKV